jgi:hypothetical protein
MIAPDSEENIGTGTTVCHSIGITGVFIGSCALTYYSWPEHEDNPPTTIHFRDFMVIVSGVVFEGWGKTISDNFADNMDGKRIVEYILESTIVAAETIYALGFLGNLPYLDNLGDFLEMYNDCS